MPVEMKAAGDGVTMSLHGDVGWDITPQAVAAALKGHGGKPLSISIHSYGGDAMAGVAVHNMIARHDGPKTVVIDGIAASAGSLIAMAGDKIIIPENGFMLIHNASGAMWGGAEDARDLADTLDKISAAYLRTYVAKSGQDAATIQALMDADQWLTAEEALAAGLVTEVSAPADIRMDARRLSVFTNLPAALLAATRPAEPAQSKEPLQMSAVTAPASEPANASATFEQITAIAARAKLGADFVVAQMTAKATEAQARDAALDALAAKAEAAAAAATAATATAAVDATARQFPEGLGLAPVAKLVRDERETRSRLMANALEHRAVTEMGVPLKDTKLDDGARQFRGLSLVEMARECLLAEGISTRGKTPMEVAEMALSGARFVMAGDHSSSDFPNLLANTASKSLRAAYEEAPRTFVPWTQRNDLPDFKSFKPMVLNNAPNLLPIPENGAVEYGTIGEGAETWNLVRYGRALGIGFVAMVNDDMSAFTRLPANFAQAAARLESDIVYQQLLANGNLADGGALFNSTAVATAGGHSNLTSGGASALSVDAAGIAAVGALEERIGRQVAPGTNSPMNLRGRYLLVPTALGTAARQLFGAGFIAATPGVVNPYATQYEVILEGRLQLGVTVGSTTNNGSSTAYYLVAGGIDTIHWGYLRGESGPTLQSTVDFDTDGMKLKVNHNFGAKAVEFRGMAKSAGQ